MLVFLHGGSYSGMSASYPLYDFTSLSGHGDVVTVSVNHRLGMLGYLYLGGLTDDDRFADAGNVGTLDPALALE